MDTKVPKSELHDRLRRFLAQMDIAHPGWGLAVISSNVNLYYFTGTVQDGILLIPRTSEAVFWVRRSYARAVDESFFPQIRPMQNYRTAAEATGDISGTVYIETEQVSLAMYQRLQKYFGFDNAQAVDGVVADIRSVKSPYEQKMMKQAGSIHRRVLEDLVPGMLREGMSEAALSGELYTVMVEEGHHGIVRFGTPGSEIILGLIGFGESSLYPTYLDTPSGNAGMSPAAPLLGSRTKKLRRGDLVFIDIGCGYNGYHTDKTMTYVFGKSLPDEAVAIHRQCLAIRDTIVPLLRPGAVPSQIYEEATAALDPAFLENFMGYGDRKVRYLGHGVGLEIAENPVIARGFDTPLQEGMFLAVEPKNGIRGIGMVGIENTFQVTRDGGRSITGNHPGLMPVG